MRPTSALPFAPAPPNSFLDIDIASLSHPPPFTTPSRKAIHTNNNTRMMQKLDATLTLALPVNAAQLGAHFQAYLDTLPALNALRACNRFGKEPQCHINKLPAELMQSIAHYYIVPAREENVEKWMSPLRCYENKCAIFGHRSKDALLEIHADMVSEEPECCECAQPSDPSEKDLSNCMADYVSDMDYDSHTDNRYNWERLVASLAKNRSLLQKHFGLDIWLSTVCLGQSDRFYSEAETTIACLSLPEREECSNEWAHFEMDDYPYDRTTCDSGCSMAVTMEPRTSPEEIQRFKRTMTVLGLDVFVHETQQNRRPLSLARTTTGQTPVVDDTAASYPRPMFLVRTHASGW